MSLRVRGLLIFAAGWLVGYRFYRDNVAPDPQTSEPCSATGAARGGIDRRRATGC